jgi:capsular exopolysaccharide synthesis family protein
MPRNKSARKQVVQPDQHVQNAAKTLLANIRFMSVDNPYKLISLTSSVPNEGKTFVTASLGQAIATSGKTCLVVECDMRRRSMAGVLGVHAQHGIYSVMSGSLALGQVVVATRTPNLYFLDAEPHIPNPSDILSSKRFGRLLQEMRATYDYVIFDTPPVGTFVDAAVLGTRVDAVFVVVRENYVHREELKNAVEQLQASGSNVAGVVMNFCEGRGSSYYDYYSSYTHGSEAEKDAPAYVPSNSRPSSCRRSTASWPRVLRTRTSASPRSSSRWAGCSFWWWPWWPRASSSLACRSCSSGAAPATARPMGWRSSSCCRSWCPSSRTSA